jgi:hypothetical protein
MKKGIFFPQIV